MLTTLRIHIIPIMPFTTMTRTEQFVTEEWQIYFADNGAKPATTIDGGWRGEILHFEYFRLY
jgi:endo-1,3(4)-beta-glucanase